VHAPSENPLPSLTQVDRFEAQIPVTIKYRLFGRKRSPPPRVVGPLPGDCPHSFQLLRVSLPLGDSLERSEIQGVFLYSSPTIHPGVVLAPLSPPLHVKVSGSPKETMFSLVETPSHPI